MYLYLFQHAIDACMETFLASFQYFGERDFFLALEKGQEIKMDMVRRMPGLFRFVMQAYYEKCISTSGTASLRRS